MTGITRQAYAEMFGPTKGDRDAASSDLQAMADGVIYQEIDLPLKDIDSDMVAAQQALQLRRLDEVDELLGRAESSLDVLTVWATEAQSQVATGASPSD